MPDLDKQTGPYVLVCACGQSITTMMPLADGARYTCSYCSSSRGEKSRMKRIRDEKRNDAIRQRLKLFSKRPLEGHQAEWFDLAQELKVDAVALEVLVEIVHRGKWRKSTAPLLYVRMNVQRLSQEWEDPFGEDGQLRRKQIFSPTATRADRGWLKLWASIREQSTIVTSDDISAAQETLKIIEDEGEREVLCARALGLTRQRYLAGVGDSERRRREAAWKRLQRHGIPAALRKALRAKSGHGAIIRPGFEDREWRDSQDYFRDRMPVRSTPVPRHEY